MVVKVMSIFVTPSKQFLYLMQFGLAAAARMGSMLRIWSRARRRVGLRIRTTSQILGGLLERIRHTLAVIDMCTVQTTL